MPIYGFIYTWFHAANVLQVDVNMVNAQKRDAVREETFYFRKNLKKCECKFHCVIAKSGS